MRPLPEGAPRARLPRSLLAAGLGLVVLLFMPGLANPFIVPKDSVVALTSAFVVLALIADRRTTVARWPGWWTAVLAAPLVALSTAALLGDSELLTCGGVLRWWIYALFFVALRYACDAADGAWLLALLAGLGGIEGLVVIAQVLAGGAIFDWSALPSAKWRAFGTLGNPNWVGGFLAATLPLALAAMQTERTRGDWISRWRARLTVGAIVAGLVLTLSRGAWMAALVGGFTLLLLRRDLGWRRIAVGCAAVATLAAAVACLSLGGGAVAAALGRSSSLAGRARMWTITASMVATRPLSGWGPGRFAAAYPPFQRAHLRAHGDSSVTDLTDHPHNEYLHLAAEAGLPALLAVLVLLALALAIASRTPTASVAAPAAASLAALAVHAGVDTALRLPAGTVVLCVLLVVIFSAAANPDAERRPLGRIERAALALLAILALVQATRLLVVDRALADGRRALASGDDARARQLLNEGLALDSAHPDLWAVMAFASRQAGDEPAALAAALRARALRPAPEIVYLVADLERRSGHATRAIAELRDLSETLPGLLLPRVLLGETLAADGQIEAARAVLTGVLTMRSKLPSPNEHTLHERAARALRGLSTHDG
jgi:putative inorganic carbon (hco3(-)) transporter